MKVTITQSTVLAGVDVSPGETVDASKQDAITLIAARKAVRFVDVEAKPAVPAIETAEAKPAVETAEAPHAKRKK